MVHGAMRECREDSDGAVVVERPTAYGATTTTNKLLTVVQHLSPACRAAHFNVASDLAAASILRSVNDVDKDDCNAVQNRLSAVALLLLFIPVLFGLLDRSAISCSSRSSLVYLHLYCSSPITSTKQLDYTSSPCMLWWC
jgi:hypothetical protein